MGGMFMSPFCNSKGKVAFVIVLKWSNLNFLLAELLSTAGNQFSFKFSDFPTKTDKNFAFGNKTMPEKDLAISNVET